MEKSNVPGTNVYNLKTFTQSFKDIKSGLKKFEVLKNDIGYQVGDTLIFEEFDPVKGRWTGAWEPKRITYKLDDSQVLKDGYVIIGIVDIKV